MYVEKRKTKRGVKYYLSHTFRHFGKVKKLAVYLGKDLTKGELEKAEKTAKRKMRERISRYVKSGDPFYTEVELEARLLKEIRPDVKIFHLSETEWKVFAELFTYNTNAIEGSTLSESDVHKVLRGRKIEADEHDVKEALGLRKAVEWIKSKPEVSISTIKKLHEIVFGETNPFAGELRNVNVVIKDAEGNVVHKGTDWRHVKKELDWLVRWYTKNKNKYHPVVLAAVVHNRFEEIHPFQDGNGRVGRLLLNLVLLSHGYPPVNIDLGKREVYYKTLQKYTNERDIRPMIKLIVKEYKKLRKRMGR